MVDQHTQMTLPPSVEDEAVALFDEAAELFTVGEFDSARRRNRRALWLMKEAVGERHPDVANILNLQGRIELARGRFSAARRCFRDAESLAREFAEVEGVDVILVQTLGNRGYLEREAGRYEPAGRLLKRAVRTARQLLGDEHPETAGVLNMLGMWCKFTGHFELGRRCYLKALKILKREYGTRHVALCPIYHNLGGLEHERGDFARAEPYARKAADIRRDIEGTQSGGYASEIAALAAVVSGLDRLDEAEALLREALVIWERIHGTEHYEVAVTLHNLAAIEAQRGQCCRVAPQLGGELQSNSPTTTAESLYRRSADIKQKVLGDEHPDLALTRHNLAVLLCEQGRIAEARPLSAASLAVFEKNLAADHPTLQLARELAAVIDA